MSTTIYESPEDAKPTLPYQGGLSIDVTTGTVWFFEHRLDGVLECATVPKVELPAIHKAIGEYLEVCLCES